MAWWLARQPVAVASDDALYFVHGLDRFSVLEFSPHFPGYPGFIALGRLVKALVGDGQAALFITSTACALALPPACAWTVWRWNGREDAALTAFFITLAQPLLPDLAVNMLSDSAGLLFVVLGLGLTNAPAGLAWGWALCCRPSYGVMIAAALVFSRRDRLAMLAGFAIISGACFGLVLAWEGWAYVDEGWRFVAGHTGQWGNTAFAPAGGPSGWARTALAHPWLLLALGGFLGRRVNKAATGVWAASLVWTLWMQNPDNLRHAAPPLILAGMLVASGWRWPGRAMLAANTAALITLTTWSPRPAPLAEAVSRLQDQPAGIVISNYGVAVLRAALPRHRVIDAYYRADAAFAQAQAHIPVWRLLADGSPGRFAGERGLRLIRAADQ